MYEIKEKLDTNTYAVCLQDNERKKFIVHKSRIRPVQTYIKEVSQMVPNDTQKPVNDLLLADKNNQLKSQRKGEEDENSKAKDHPTASVKLDGNKRPRRQAAENAKFKMKNMK